MAVTAPSLTAREESLLRELRFGKSDKAIAFDLGLTRGTVKDYLFDLRRKLGADNRVQLALWAERRAVNRERAA
jgi:DNA-binding NarL/FixJ family response regulator